MILLPLKKLILLKKIFLIMKHYSLRNLLSSKKLIFYSRWSLSDHIYLLEKRFLFEGYPPSYENDFTLKTRFPSGLFTLSPPRKDSFSSLKPLSLKTIGISLETSALVWSARSHSSLMPSKRTHRSPFREKTFSSVRKTYSSHLEILHPEKSSSFHALKTDHSI